MITERKVRRSFRLLSLLLGLAGLVAILGQALRPAGVAVQAEQTGVVLVELTPGVLVLPPDSTVQVALDAGTEKIGFARLELLFDPAVIALTAVESGSQLAPVTTSTLAEANATGRVVIAGRAPEDGLPTGHFPIATLHFTPATEREEQQTTLAVDPAGVQIVTEQVAEAPVTTTSVRIGANPASVTCLPIGEIPLAECEALKSFFSGSDGGQWGNWFTTTAPCQGWTGISCEAGHVTGLHLAARGVEATLPAALGGLPYLEVLNLAHNHFTGAIPAAFGTLTRLESLDLHANRLAGVVPPALSTLSGLAKLDLGYNLLSAPDSQTVAYLDARDPDWAETQTVPPAGLAIAETTSTALTLTWQPVLDGEGTGFYELYRAPAADGPYSFLETTTGTAAAGYALDGLAPDTTYFFKMRTYTPANGEQARELLSTYTGAVSATTPLPPPAGISASRGTYTGRIRLSWEPVPGATAYQIYRAGRLAGPQTLLATTTGMAYEDTTATAGKIYFYWLSTCKAGNCSEAGLPVLGWHGEVPTVYAPAVRKR